MAFSGITTSAAQQLGLKTKHLPSSLRISIQGQNASNLIAVPELKMDRLSIRDLEIPEIPTLTDADGTVALDILAANDLELDLAHDRLNVFSRDHCKGKVVYWTASGGVAAVPFTTQKSGNLLANMNLDSRSVRVGFATMGHSMMGMNVAHRLFGIDEHSPALRVIGTTPGGSAVYHYPFGEISIEGLSIKDPDIVLSGNVSDPECDAREHRDPSWSFDPTSCYGGADLYLGPSVLRRLHLFFAFGEKMLYATAS